MSAAAELQSLKTLLRSLVVSNPTTMDVNHLKKDYRENIGENIPVHKYGYSNLADFLKRECSDIFQFGDNPFNPTLCPVIVDEIRHIDQFIARQKSAKPKNQKQSRVMAPRNQSQMIHRQQDAENVYQKKCNTNKKNQLLGSKRPLSQSQVLQQDSCSVKSSSISSSPDVLSSNNKHNSDNSGSDKCSRNHTKNENRSDKCSSDKLHRDKHSRINDKLINELRCLMRGFPNGIQSIELPSAYSKRFRCELEYDRLGFASVVALCSSLPDVFLMTQPQRLGEYRLFITGTIIPSHYQDCHSEQPNLHIWKQEKDKGDVDVLGGDALPGVPINSSVYLPDCLNFSDNLLAPKQLHIDAVVQVVICEVRDPSHFWFQVVSSHHTNYPLDTLMKEMDLMYTEETKLYCMQQVAVRSGQVCAAPYSNKYHRCIIRKTNGVTAKIHYVDYGTVADVPVSQLRFLRRESAKLSMQGRRGRLHGARSLAGSLSWTNAARHHFLNLVSERVLNARLRSIESEEEVCVLELTDCSTNESIVDILIAEGHATEWTSSPSVSSLMQSSQYDYIPDITYNMPLIDNMNPKESEPDLCVEIPMRLFFNKVKDSFNIEEADIITPYDTMSQVGPVNSYLLPTFADLESGYATSFTDLNQNEASAVKPENSPLADKELTGECYCRLQCSFYTQIENRELWEKFSREFDNLDLATKNYRSFHAPLPPSILTSSSLPCQQTCMPDDALYSPIAASHVHNLENISDFIHMHTPDNVCDPYMIYGSIRDYEHALNNPHGHRKCVGSYGYSPGHVCVSCYEHGFDLGCGSVFAHRSNSASILVPRRRLVTLPSHRLPGHYAGSFNSYLDESSITERPFYDSPHAMPHPIYYGHSYYMDLYPQHSQYWPDLSPPPPYTLSSCPTLSPPGIDLCDKNVHIKLTASEFMEKLDVKEATVTLKNKELEVKDESSDSASLQFDTLENHSDETVMKNIINLDNLTVIEANGVNLEVWVVEEVRFFLLEQVALLLVPDAAREMLHADMVDYLLTLNYCPGAMSLIRRVRSGQLSGRRQLQGVAVPECFTTADDISLHLVPVNNFNSLLNSYYDRLRVPVQSILAIEDQALEQRMRRLTVNI